jgi:hypothetical protein
MDHPNIAKVLDGGTTASGRPYFVMDLVNGVPITEYCDKNQLAPRERLELFVSVCLAVQHAHQKGIIHRDLKPSNVMVTVYEGTPTVKVIDFGVAKALSQELTDKTLITGLAQMIGTPLYMSPEQAGQGALDIDTRSDIYSLGVLLYELLTGTTPIDKVRFKQAAYDEIRRIIREEEPPKPSTRLIELGRSSLRSGPNSAADPVGRSEHTSLDSLSAVRDTEPVKLTRLMRGELDWIVMKALEKDRNRRYETANALAMDIDRFLHEQPVLACPPSATYQLRKFARRNRAALAMTTLVGVVFLFGSIISIWQAVRATQAEGLAMRRLDEVDLARKTAVGERIRAEQRLFDARLAEARASRLSRQVGHRSQIWRALAETARLARELKLGSDRLMELRNEAIACLAITDVLPVHEWEGFPSGSSGIAFDANIEHYARSGLKGDISVRRVSDDQELTLLAGEKLGDLSLGATALVFSPDGSYLAVRNLHPSPGQSSELRIWDWRLGQCIMQPSFNVSSAAFSPNSRLVALGQEKGILSIHEVPGGKEEKRIDSGVNAYAMAFDPDGSRLAVASYAGHEIQVRETATGDLLEKWTTPSGILHIAWKSDGLLLATAGFDRNAYVWNPATGLQHVLLQGHQDVIGSVVFSPSHDIVVTQSCVGKSRVLGG